MLNCLNKSYMIECISGDQSSKDSALLVIPFVPDDTFFAFNTNEVQKTFFFLGILLSKIRAVIFCAASVTAFLPTQLR